ncbi:MAG: hypothetical protein AAGH89_19135 [Verrucomicrobiota bacterium]
MPPKHPDPLENWKRHRREDVPETPKNFSADLLRLLRPPKSRSWSAWSLWLGRAALFLAAIAIGVARTYASLFLILES